MATCFLLSRAATAAFASFLASRRFRDLAFVALALFGVVMGIGGNLIGGLAGTDPTQMRGSPRHLAAALAGWSPFGWAWSMPGRLSPAGTGWSRGSTWCSRSALVGALWRAWGYFLAARLISPIEGGGGSREGPRRSASSTGSIRRRRPAGSRRVRCATGGAIRAIFAGIAGFLIAPIIIMVTQLVNPNGSAGGGRCWHRRCSACCSGMSVAQDLSYDGIGDLAAHLGRACAAPTTGPAG